MIRDLLRRLRAKIVAEIDAYVDERCLCTPCRKARAEAAKKAQGGK